MFVVRYHKVKDRMPNRLYEREFKDPAGMCSWANDRVRKQLIDWFEIWQCDPIYREHKHDVTEVYSAIIYSGLTALQVKNLSESRNH